MKSKEEIVKEYNAQFLCNMTNDEFDSYIKRVLEATGVNLTLEQIKTVDAINTVAFHLRLDEECPLPQNHEKCNFIHDEGPEPEDE